MDQEKELVIDPNFFTFVENAPFGNCARGNSAETRKVSQRIVLSFRYDVTLHTGLGPFTAARSRTSWTGLDKLVPANASAINC
jgi:hypothetical protein